MERKKDSEKFLSVTAQKNYNALQKNSRRSLKLESKVCRLIDEVAEEKTDHKMFNEKLETKQKNGFSVMKEFMFRKNESTTDS